MRIALATLIALMLLRSDETRVALADTSWNKPLTQYKHDGGYIYQEVWWRELRSDPHTALMLHFGPTQDHAWLAAGNARSQKPQTDVVLDEVGFDDLFGDEDEPDMTTMSGDLIDRKTRKGGRDPQADAPPGKVFDYSANLLAFALPPGAEKTPNGRFGAGLRLDGESGLMLRLEQEGAARLGTMEGWFKPDGLPEQKVCLMACKDGAMLLLRPDGHLELTWDSAQSGQRERIVSDQPIEPGRWRHLVARAWVGKHIEKEKNTLRFQILINARVAASLDRGTVRDPKRIDELFPRGRFSLGADPQGERAFRGWVDDVRVSGARRYNRREIEPWLDPQAEREIALGPPHFPEDGVVFYASLDQLALDISHPPGQRIGWDLSPEDFAKQQFPGVRGQALAIDPAMGFPRIPIKGMDFTAPGSLELWYQPMNWDNHTDRANWLWSYHKSMVILARLYGRDRRTGEKVQFADIHTTRSAIHGNADWYEPGQWNHMVWRWDPQSKEHDSFIRARRFGEESWRMVLKTDAELLPHVEPLYIEFGIDNTAENQDVQGLRGERPGIMIDEVVGYNYRMSDEQVERALKRWKGELDQP